MKHPLENTDLSPQWPHRNEESTSLITNSKGTELSPFVPTVGNAGGAMFIQNWVKPNFGTDQNAHYSAGGLIETALVGGNSGALNLDVGVTKLNGDYPLGNAGIVGQRVFADGSKTSHHKGIVTALWPMVKSYPSREAGNIATSVEVNSFTWFEWDPKNPQHYVKDPFDHAQQQCVIGILINNYQDAYKEYGGVAGQYQNAFGMAITNLGPADADGRAFGYQTGIYISDCSMEAIRINCGVYKEGWNRTDYGIKLENVAGRAGIGIGPNKVNWGGHPGVLEQQGDNFYNTVSDIFWFMGKGNVPRQILSASAVVNATPVTPTHKIRVKFGGQEYDLLAVKV